MIEIPEIKFSDELRAGAPNLVLGNIVCEVQNAEYNQYLWEIIENACAELRSKLKIEEVKKNPSIFTTREAYKACGKDPNRYRPSAEQLQRRVLQGKDLYQISALVDLVNLVSLESAYSIGGFDLSKVEGKLVYGVGQKDEIYNGIGRGVLNIDGMPVLRDEVGGIGTPTSDEERTKISLNTKYFLMNINAFDGDKEKLDATIESSITLLKSTGIGKNFKIAFNPKGI